MNFLFLGDSITDCGRNFDPENLGNGYVRKLLSPISARYPSEQIHFINTGIDGQTLPGLYNVWKQLPDQTYFDRITILIGINDVGLVMDQDFDETVMRKKAKEFALCYRDLLEDIMDQTETKPVIFEPFLFYWPERYNHWMPCLRYFQEEIKALADYFHLTFVPLHNELNALASEKGAEAITLDGFHLTDYGNQFLSEKFLAHL